MLAGIGGVPPTDRSAYVTVASTTGAVWPVTNVKNLTSVRSGLRRSGDQVHTTLASLPLLVVVRRIGPVSDNGSVGSWHRGSPYAPTGESKLVSGAFQAGTITLCNPSLRGGEARTIVINASGRPRVQKAWVASCA